MNRTIDVRTEMRKLADSKPVHAAAGAGVQSRDDQMAGESRADGDGRRFFIANLTDDQNLWILPQ